MPPLTEQDRTELIRLLQAGEQIPANWRTKLFPGGPQSVEIGKEYRLSTQILPLPLVKTL